jgi:hypothetical protein
VGAAVKHSTRSSGFAGNYSGGRFEFLGRREGPVVDKGLPPRMEFVEITNLAGYLMEQGQGLHAGSGDYFVGEI